MNINTSEKGKCIIICAGKYHEKDASRLKKVLVPGSDLIIAADAGLEYAIKADIVPDIIVGDFDSLPEGGLVSPEEYAEEHGSLVIRLKPVKDETDTLKALQIGLEHGYTEFHLFFATGRRLDHTMANVQCLKYLKANKADGFIHDNGSAISVINGPEEVQFPEGVHGNVSIFASGRTKGVNIKGLRYEAEDLALTDTFPLGVSNELVGAPASISVQSGTLLVFFPDLT